MASDLAGQDALVSELLAIGPPLCHSAAEPNCTAQRARLEYLASPDVLANDNVPDTIGTTNRVPLLKHESPRHRDIVMMRLAGFTSKEIADELGVTRATVNVALRQPWARKRLIEHIHRSKEHLLAFLEQEAAPSVLTLVELRDAEDAPKAVRRQAADSLLDRYLGKASQTINLNKSDVPQDTAELERRLFAAQQEEKRLRGN